jgi:hypothetical protein
MKKGKEVALEVSRYGLLFGHVNAFLPNLNGCHTNMLRITCAG